MLINVIFVFVPSIVKPVSWIICIIGHACNVCDVLLVEHDPELEYFVINLFNKLCNWYSLFAEEVGSYRVLSF